MTASLWPSTATVPVSTALELPPTPLAGIQSSDQLPRSAQAFKVSLRHARHHAKFMMTFKIWIECCGSVDEASVLYEKPQPAVSWCDDSLPTVMLSLAIQATARQRWMNRSLHVKVMMAPSKRMIGRVIVRRKKRGKARSGAVQVQPARHEQAK